MAKNDNQYTFHPNVIFRTPLFPMQDSGYQKTEYENRLFSEAIYLSSPDLFYEIQKFNQNLTLEAKNANKLNISLYKYNTRSQTRCTPFGLFAAVSTGKWDKTNFINLKNYQESLIRKTRLDMNVVCALSQELIKKDYIKANLRFYANTSLYQIDNAYRYIEYFYINTTRVHKITKVDFSEYLSSIITEAKKGCYLKSLSNILTNQGIHLEEAISFIDELIDSQILISELEPTVTGKDFFEKLIQTLQNINDVNPNTDLTETLFCLSEINQEIKILDENIVNDLHNENLYIQIYSKLKNILPNLKESNLFQTDLYKKGEDYSINNEIQNKIIECLNFLNKITPNYSNKNLEEFKNRFHARYADSEIPLLQALDPETGIGYPYQDVNGINPLVDDLVLNNKGTENQITWTKVQSTLSSILQKCFKENAGKIILTDEDFSEVDFSSNNLSTSFSVMFKVLNSSENKISFKNTWGSSAVNILGRFANGDKNILDIINDIVKHEEKQYSDKIIAEIVHLPESRTGNILSRPIFRDYEIAYLAKSSVDNEFKIDPSELLISIKNNKILLKWKKNGKEVLPRLGNAHNYSYNSLPVYQFLCELQHQYTDKQGLGFTWGVLENHYKYFPRVEYKSTVLHPAKWKIEKKDYEILLDKSKTIKEKNNLFNKLKNEYELPDKFFVVEGDNELLIDVKNNDAILTFIDLIKNKTSVTIEEYLFNEHESLITDINNNTYTNECLAVILNNTSIPNASGKAKTITTEKVTQNFSIGSEWLYYKIYCGVKTADIILTEKLLNSINLFLNEKMIDKWFFIRYADPEPHIRLRLHITHFKYFNDIVAEINSVLSPLLDKNILSKIQIDTYQRELLRYGYNTIELAESLFYYDSVCIAKALSLIDGEKGEIFRWHFAIRATDQFLDDFNFKFEDKLAIMTQLSISFFNEHGGTKDLKVQLDKKYRLLKKDIEDILNKDIDQTKEIYPLIELINDRSKFNRVISKEIITLNQTGELQVNYFDLISSYIHMMLNRLFIAKNRTNEFIVYDLLAKYYKSHLAKRQKAISFVRNSPN